MAFVFGTASNLPPCPKSTALRSDLRQNMHCLERCSFSTNLPFSPAVNSWTDHKVAHLRCSAGHRQRFCRNGDTALFFVEEMGFAHSLDAVCLEVHRPESNGMHAMSG